MSRLRRSAKPIAVLIAVVVLALVVSACALVKPNSLSLSQPGGIGSVRVHFALCTEAVTECEPNGETQNFQYVLGIAVPPGSTPPATITATPVSGGASITFTRNDEVATEIEAGSEHLQKFLEEEALPPEAGPILGGNWPPSGLQGFGYISDPFLETEGSTLEWSVDADFGAPQPANGSAFAGPFGTGIAFGFRLISPTQQANRPVHCFRFEGEPQASEAFCSGTMQQKQIGTSELRIAAPAKAAGVFVGGKVPISFAPTFASSAPTPPAIAYTASSTLKGAKAVASTNGTVNLTVPNNAKPGTYEVTLTGTAQVPNGASTSATAKFKVTKPKLKLGAVKLNKAKGTATLSVKVPSAGTLTASGKGLVKAKKKAKKAKTLKITIKAKGATKTELAKSGKARVKAKISFKPSSGITVKKTKSIALKQS